MSRLYDLLWTVQVVGFEGFEVVASKLWPHYLIQPQLTAWWLIYCTLQVIYYYVNNLGY